MNNIQLLKGDCIELMKGIKENTVDLILTDLPYGITNCSWDNKLDFQLLWQQYTRIIKENGAILLFAVEPFASELRLSNLKMYKYDWIWKKTNVTGHLNANRQPLRTYENILVFYKKQPFYNPQKSQNNKPMHNYTKYIETQNKTQVYGKANKELTGGGSTERFPTNIITFASDKQKSKLHPTQKPVALLEYLINTYTKQNELVLDSCMGSGSTGIACINTNRNFIGIEIDAKYYEISKKRIEERKKYETNKI